MRRHGPALCTLFFDEIVAGGVVVCVAEDTVDQISGSFHLICRSRCHDLEELFFCEKFLFDEKLTYTAEIVN
jgi:hypothetical protein